MANVRRSDFGTFKLSVAANFFPFSKADLKVEITDVIIRIEQSRYKLATYTLYSKSVALSGSIVVWVSVLGIISIPLLAGTTVFSVNRSMING